MYGVRTVSGYYCMFGCGSSPGVSVKEFPVMSKMSSKINRTSERGKLIVKSGRGMKANRFVHCGV